MEAEYEYDKWIKSDHYAQFCNPRIIPPPEKREEFMEKRLRAAFFAGVNSGQIIERETTCKKLMSLFNL